MSVLLPTSPGIRSAKPRLRDFGGWIEPSTGGKAQRLNRLGNRFGADIQVATSRSTDTGRVIAARLMRGLTEGILLPFPQDFDPGNVGQGVTVDGGGQQGSILNLKGFPAGYVVREGQFFSLIHGGRRYVHAAAADMPTTGGRVQLPIFPMLRVIPNDGEVCEFDQPMIEGFITGNELAYALQTAPYLDVSFTMTEAA
jgi:hypothetical protein